MATPLRIAGPLGRVHFIVPGRQSVYGTVDCRLVLALHDFAALLESHGVIQVQIDNLYRPRARLPRRKVKRSQHAYGLAVDILGLKLGSGRVILVERDWRGQRATPPCGPGSSPAELTEAAVLLRNILCGAAKLGLFHHFLTPNYDRAHQNHFHLDIQRNARAIIVR